jgi:hypothetical protein
MKQIINGKAYNTVTATEICDAGNALSSQDFGFERSELYVTRKGAYFVAGRGGPMSRFSRNTGNGWTGGEGIIPLSRQDALAEAEEHASSKVIEEFFSDILEGV